VRTVAIPYVVFEALIAAFRIDVGGEKLEDLFTDPHWPMWYLSALFVWRLLTPVFVAMGTALAVSIAVVASLVAGLYAGDVLDVARMLGLLPFFVLGLKATPERMERLRNGAARGWAVVVLAVIAVLATWTDTWARTEWLYYRSRYDELVTSDLEALVIRSVLLVVGTLGSLAFLALVPRLSGWFSRMGAWTLVVYLFHGFVVKSAAYAGFDDWADRQELLSLPLATCAAAAVALLLAWRPVATRLNVLVDPVGFAQREVETAHELRDAGVRTDRLADELAETVREADAVPRPRRASPVTR
jgi:fucose 4-O-acetylase-like acetyltransferase